ncbi:hypothetical protein SLA2020_276290 [Shorea laevis]
MFLATAPSPKVPITHKTITIPFAFFFTNTSRTARTPSVQPEQPPKHEPQEPEDSYSITNRSYWTKKIHRLCAEDRNVDEALSLLDRLSLAGTAPIPSTLAA